MASEFVPLASATIVAVIGGAVALLRHRQERDARRREADREPRRVAYGLLLRESDDYLSHLRTMDDLVPFMPETGMWRLAESPTADDFETAFELATTALEQFADVGKGIDAIAGDLAIGRLVRTIRDRGIYTLNVIDSDGLDFIEDAVTEIDDLVSRLREACYRDLNR